MLQYDWSRQYRADTETYAFEWSARLVWAYKEIRKQKQRSKRLEQLPLNLPEERVMNQLKQLNIPGMVQVWTNNQISDVQIVTLAILP